MITSANQNLLATALGCALSFTNTVARAADSLPSWNDTASKQSIVAFVEKVTKEGSPDFVPAPERIAVFDNDGTLWSEQPMYFQAFFIFDRIKQLAPQHCEQLQRFTRQGEQSAFADVVRRHLDLAFAGSGPTRRSSKRLRSCFTVWRES